MIGYYRHPTIFQDWVVFVAEDDLWMVSAEGGDAFRLTANPGTETYPRFSPDGTQIAFVGRDEGRLDTYVMPAAGGSSRRVSYLGANTQVLGWTPDGGSVLVSTDYQQPFEGWGHLWRIPLEGPEPVPMGWGPARGISYEKGGPGVVIARNSFDPARWKRYRGGRAGSVWIDRDGDGVFTTLIDPGGNLADPMWIGRRVYFLSDHEGVGNIYSVTPTGTGMRRHTHHDDFYARFPSSDGRQIVYHCGADLWVFDPRKDETRSVEVNLPSARPQRNRRFIPVTARNLESTSLHPEGHSLAAVVRGGVYSMPLWEGSPTRHGLVSEARQRLPEWLADGKSLVMVSDESGEDELVVTTDSATVERRRRTRRADLGRLRSLYPSPTDADSVAVTNHRHELLLVNPSNGRSRLIHRSPHGWTAGVSWSPDGAFLAFGAVTSRTTSNICIYEVSSGRTHILGSPEFEDWNPSFDPDGKYLAFISVRAFEPIPDSHFHDYGFPRGGMLMLVPLLADTPSPFAQSHRKPRAPGAPPDGTPPKSPEAPTDPEATDEVPTPPPATTKIDFEGWEERVVAFPTPPGVYSRLALARGRAFFLVHPLERAANFGEEDGPPGARLDAWDFGTDKVETVAEGVTGFTVSRDGKVLAYRNKKALRVVPAGFKDDKSGNERIGRETGFVDLDRLRVEIIPGAEWKQMFSEAWRLQRDYYWWETMGGVDWPSIHDRYRDLVDRVASRAEFSDLLWEMQGELGTSHAYELGGDYRPAPVWTQGHLGARLTYERGGWRVIRIPQGDSWDPRASSPLAAPGIGVEEGDRIVAIDDRPVDARVSPASRLVERGGRTAILTIRRGRAKLRRVVVNPLNDETRLWYRDWVRSNREYLSERSEGRVGYIHIPDMGPTGFGEFHRSWKSEVDRQGLVVDVRFNRGGNVSQLLLERLLRERVGYRITRWRDPSAMPDDAPMGPMVCLTNENAGSDGDIFSHVFKMKGLGPLIGTRTWGGVVGIWPQQSLVDGTVTTQPEFHTWFTDVGYAVENFGATPDLEVVNSPQDYAREFDRQLEVGLEELLRLIELAPSTPEFGDRPLTKPPSFP
ncbi:MAG TPA: S41 family peptidase, partial [Acidimicrobiia bacterium]|nr:S41 family peptidase [Acidimicrobiia bacterium]